MRREEVALRAAAAAQILLVAGCTSSSSGKLPPISSPTPSPTGVVGGQHGLPAPGAPGFPAAIYPTAVHGKRAVRRCPNPVGLQMPGPHMRTAATTIAERFQTGPQNRELHAADRAIWPEIYTDAQSRKFGTAGPAHLLPVLSAGRLLGRYTGGGAPNPATWIKSDCPPQVAMRSYEVAIGPRNGPALDGVFVFVQRAGRALLYFVYP